MLLYCLINNIYKMVAIVVNSTIVGDAFLEAFLTDFPLEILIEIYEMYKILSPVDHYKLNTSNLKSRRVLHSLEE